ncbi:branched-chain amino acid ABC transporter substrate-binding protein [Rhodopseudomonas boonkerdii]|uniref:ABC transporter substrate-binding protein n=1 Tax=Rhodopseudomonas boonkerdii TaxID=475937 RepID=UPI001E381B77|nr:ABC transporter substrate-binding protein [Rhodopseudomonas boonkerdii]UGV26029.1 branched-chain amino acid ABC transporter substrate-binding protein [Rhodopseudomonas boonkerdii]
MMTLDRRHFLVGTTATAITLISGKARAADTTGITPTSIKIGSTSPQSGPVSAYGVQARCQAAFFKMINDRGGINGRKIDFIYYDDAFNPAKTVEQTRKLVENDEVAFLFSNLGTAPNSAIVKYMNTKKVPHLFLSVNGDKWSDYKTSPWSMGFAPSARTEAAIFVKHMLADKPDAKFAVLYQNDDFGKDFVLGAKDALGARESSQLTIISHETSDPTIDSQILRLKSAAPDALISGTTAKFTAQAIRKIAETGWKVRHYITGGSSSYAGTIGPAGPENSVGVLSSAYLKDVADPAWKDDQGIANFLAFMQKYFSEGNKDDFYNLYAYTVASALVKVLEQCGSNVTRENIMAQAANLKDVMLPTLLPGIHVNTSPTNYRPLTQVQLQKWDGKAWVRFGEVLGT